MLTIMLSLLPIVFRAFKRKETSFIDKFLGKNNKEYDPDISYVCLFYYSWKTIRFLRILVKKYFWEKVKSTLK